MLQSQARDSAAHTEKTVPSPGWVTLGVLSAALFGSAFVALWPQWRSDLSISHGPLVPLIAIGLFWSRRGQLHEWKSSSGIGLAIMTVSALVFVGVAWADITFR